MQQTPRILLSLLLSFLVMKDVQTRSAPFCEGKIDIPTYFFLNRVCEDCFSLYRDPEIYSVCRGDCFGSMYFAGCMQSLMVDQETQGRAARYIRWCIFSIKITLFWSTKSASSKMRVAWIEDDFKFGEHESSSLADQAFLALCCGECTFTDNLPTVYKFKLWNLPVVNSPLRIKPIVLQDFFFCREDLNTNSCDHSCLNWSDETPVIAL